MDHAEVKIGDYTIPLIGIPPEATEYTCDGCHKKLTVEKLELNERGNQFLCEKCRKQSIA